LPPLPTCDSVTLRRRPLIGDLAVTWVKQVYGSRLFGTCGLDDGAAAAVRRRSREQSIPATPSNASRAAALLSISPGDHCGGRASARSRITTTGEALAAPNLGERVTGHRAPDDVSVEQWSGNVLTASSSDIGLIPSNIRPDFTRRATHARSGGERRIHHARPARRNHRQRLQDA
jgi:hypothetical protein